MKNTYHLNFAHGGAIKRAAQPGQQTDNGRVRVALDGVERFDHG